MDSQEMLAAYDWPGNVRELQNVIERSVILSSGGELKVTGIPDLRSESPHAGTRSLKEDLNGVERRNIVRVLEGCDWKIKGEGNAANQLGLKPSTLRSRMKRLGILRPSSSIR